MSAERLQHGVVHARGELLALLRADPRGAFGVPLAREPERPRREHEDERDGDRAGGEQRGRAPARVLAEEDDDAGDHEQCGAEPHVSLAEPERHRAGREHEPRERRARAAGQRAGRDPTPRRVRITDQTEEHDP